MLYMDSVHILPTALWDPDSHPREHRPPAPGSHLNVPACLWSWSEWETLILMWDSSSMHHTCPVYLPTCDAEQRSSRAEE